MTDPQMTRRQVLAGGLGGAAALGLAALGGPAASGAETVRRAASVKAAGNDLGAIKHVVFLMQENRSFDHYFGTMAGVQGFDDTNNRERVHPGVARRSPVHLLPFRMDTKTQQAECTYDLSHSSWRPSTPRGTGGPWTASCPPTPRPSTRVRSASTPWATT